jgi:beta propeller repeat protein
MTSMQRYGSSLLVLAAVMGGADSTLRAQAPGTIRQLSTGSVNDQQNQPAISGPLVVWTNVSTPPGGATDFDTFLFPLPFGPATNVTNTPTDQEFMVDVDGGAAVWTHTNASTPGDIVAYDFSTNVLMTIASSSATVRFEQPAIHGKWVAFIRHAQQSDVYLYDLKTQMAIGLITNDSALQARPRVGDDFVVYEDYASGNADVFGYQIPTGPTFPIASGAGNQITPDISGNTVVWIEQVAGVDQVFMRTLPAGSAVQLTQSVSDKILPRISATRIVWSDDRNGNLDLFMYDLATSLEQPLVTGAGDQFLPDIDGDHVVYTDNAAGFEQVYLFTFAPELTEVGIDIRPRETPNNINPRSQGKVAVAILSDNGFDTVAQIDRTSLTFGRTGDEPSLAFCNAGGDDVNGDGLPDLICHFSTQLTGFQPSDSVGTLKAVTVTGKPVKGTDSVRIVSKQ